MEVVMRRGQVETKDGWKVWANDGGNTKEVIRLGSSGSDDTEFGVIVLQSKVIEEGIE